MKILVIHGPNLDLLGSREPDVYGHETLEGIMADLGKEGVALGAEIESYQSNNEGELVSRIGQSAKEFDGLLINPAAYTHTSIAMRDALMACGLPAVEVHLSNTAAREEFRHHSYTAGACIGVVTGFGPTSYLLALQGLVDYIRKQT